MGHIFISYSHKDTLYVHRLRERLISEGFDVWIDDRIDYGDEWPMVIQEHLDTCDAFILIATENSYKSKWVQKEVTRAQRIDKPFFPLLVDGHPWLSIESTQYVDVRDKSLPPERFYQRLARVSPRRKVPVLPLQPGQRPVLTPALQPTSRARQRTDSKPVGSPPRNAAQPNPPEEAKVHATEAPISKKLAALREALTQRLRKTSRRTILIVASAMVILLIVLGGRAVQERKSEMIAEATYGPMATRQAATIGAALTQTALSRQLTGTALPPTNTPVIARATNTPVLMATSNPATATVAAAFTQIALSSKTVIPTSTVPTATRATATPEPSDAILFLDKNYSCHGGPSTESPTRIAVVSGLKLPIIGKSEQDNWWLVRIQSKDLTYDYCWIQGGVVEGDRTSIKTIKP